MDSDGLNVEQRKYVDNNSFRDEWYLHLAMQDTGAPVEGQKMSNWCWVAVARMFAKTLYPNVTRTQNEAVISVKGKEVNENGTIPETKLAIEDYVSYVYGASVDIVARDNNSGYVYSEESLRMFLDDGYPICVGRGNYKDISNRYSANGGHITLIYGYTKQTIQNSDGTTSDKYWFLVRDPLPENQGKSYMISYEKLYNGRNPQGFEKPDIGVWDGVIVVRTSYSNWIVSAHFH